MPVANVRRRGMGSPERGGGEREAQVTNLCYGETCATECTQVENLCYTRRAQVTNLCYVSRQRYMRKLKVCQRRRRSHWPTVRLPTWIRAVPRMPGVNTASASSSVISAS